MKLEEILPFLRQGKKARISSYDDKGEYWISGYSILLGGEKIPTIHRLNKEGQTLVDQYSWGIPRWAIVCDDWEIVA